MLKVRVESYGQLKERMSAGASHPTELSKRARRVLFGSVIVTVLLYMIPLGGFVIYPLMLLSTLVHELGHGVMAEIVGGDFQRFQMFADGSGVAHHTGNVGNVGRALISAGGLVGPAIMAGVGFVVARRKKASRILLGIGAVALLAAEILVVRNGFGLVFVGAIIAGLGWLVWRKSAETIQFVLVFLSVQLSLSVFSRGDYLFTEYAETGAGRLPSDVTHMAQALGGPYWVWGLACGAFSVLMLAGGMWVFLKGFPRPFAKLRARFSKSPKKQA